MVKEQTQVSQKPKDTCSLSEVVAIAKTADPEALELLAGHLLKKFKKYFSLRLPQGADDLAQDTTIRIINNLANFDPTRGRGTYEENFNNWSFVIARYTLISKIRREKPMLRLDEEFAQPELQSPTDESPALHKEAFRERLTQVLTPSEFKIATLKLEGKTDKDIVKELASTDSSVRSRLSRARKKIDEQLLFPAGYKRVAGYGNRGLKDGVSRRNLQAVKFLGMWYTTDEAVRLYQRIIKSATNNYVFDQTLLDNGHLLLSHHVTPAEYSTLTNRPRYRHLLTSCQGRLYITPEKLEEFRRATLKAKPPRISSPGPEYRQLVNFAQTEKDYNRLIYAAQSGRLEARKVGNWWFTTQEEYDQFLNKVEVKNQAKK